MNNILLGLGRTIWHSYHLRDPITRAIASYFELHRRNETELVKNDMTAMNSFRYLLSMMENRMDCSLANKDKMSKMRDYTIGDIF